MKQEVEIVVRMSVDTRLSKIEIERFVDKMFITGDATARERWEFGNAEVVKVKEESEIYNSK